MFYFKEVLDNLMVRREGFWCCLQAGWTRIFSAFLNFSHTSDQSYFVNALQRRSMDHRGEIMNFLELVIDRPERIWKLKGFFFFHLYPISFVDQKQWSYKMIFQSQDFWGLCVTCKEAIIWKLLVSICASLNLSLL